MRAILRTSIQMSLQFFGDFSCQTTLGQESFLGSLLWFLQTICHNCPELAFFYVSLVFPENSVCSFCIIFTFSWLDSSLVKLIQQLKQLRQHFKSPAKIAENTHTFFAMVLFYVLYCISVLFNESAQLDITMIYFVGNRSIFVVIFLLQEFT